MHYKMVIALLILVTISLLTFSVSNALIVYLRPPKMIIRVNTSIPVERSLVIENRNNISMSINASITGNISDVITIKNPAFEILPNVTKNIDFVTNAINSGSYSGQILVTYTASGNKTITLSSDITITATKNPNSNSIPIMPILIVVIVLIIIVSVFFLKRGRNRW